MIGWLAWPLLFCGLGALFLWGFAMDTAAWSWLLVGVLFEAMGLVPLVLGLLADARSVVIGSVSVGGTPFARSGRRPDWLPPARGERGAAVEPTARDWLLATGTTVVGGLAGVLLGIALFRAVA